MKRFALWSFSLVLGLLISAPASGDTVFLQAARDNTLFESPTGSLSSGAGPAIFVGNNSAPSKRRGLLKFDVAAGVPAGAVIDSVELRLYVSNAPNTIPQPIELHRALADWGEGASSSGGGSGAPAQAGDATWLHTFYPNAFWAAAGGDFDGAVSAVTVVGGIGFYAWSDTAMVSDVQGWLDTPATNFGWLLLGDETEPSSARRIDSRENTVESNRPVLVIVFTPPDVNAEPSTWGRIKELFHHPPSP